MALGILPATRGIESYLRYAAGTAPAGDAWDMRTAAGLGTESFYRFSVPANRGYAISAVNFLVADEGLRIDQFGAITLVNGCFFRVTPGPEMTASFDFANGTAIMTLGDLAVISGSPLIASPAATGPEYVALSMRMQDLLGAPLELGPGDTIEWVNRDDLTGLDIFRATVTGRWLR